MTPASPYADLPTFAAHLRAVLDPAGINKKCVLLYAYNGTGKTRLSMAFKAFCTGYASCVIASVARQSSAACTALDCFAASRLAMTIRILSNLRDQYIFNPELFDETQQAATA
jgi:hypothetical protein